MSTDAKYLRITMHDNDFSLSLEFVGNLLKEIFKFERYPTEEDLSTLKDLVAHLLYGADNIMNNIHWKELYAKVPLEYFQTKCKLEFVDYLDIPSWDNCENIYIPMFDGDILIR